MPYDEIRDVVLEVDEKKLSEALIQVCVHVQMCPWACVCACLCKCSKVLLYLTSRGFIYLLIIDALGAYCLDFFCGLFFVQD